MAVLAQRPESRVMGGAVRADIGLIEVYVAELEQLFHAIDPSPVREKDLDPAVEEFIVGWSREIPRDAPLALVVHVEPSACCS
jgi:hypothetical protein